MPTTFSEPTYFVEAREIAARVPMARLLEVLCFNVDTRSHRCSCRLHGGANPSAFSWTEAGLWKCFGCGASGDKISLVRAARKYNFRETVGFLAAVAGVELGKNKLPYTEIEQVRALRQTEERGASFLAKTQHNLCLELGRELDSLRKIYRKASAELTAGHRQELCWAALKFVADTLPHTDTAYCIAAFAPPLERAKFALHPELRTGMIATAMERGYVSDAKGYRFQVPLQ